MQDCSDRAAKVLYRSQNASSAGDCDIHVSCARWGSLKKRDALRWSAPDSDWFATVWMQPHNREFRAFRSDARQARLMGPLENRVTIPLSLRSNRFPPHPATNAVTMIAAKTLIAPVLFFSAAVIRVCCPVF